ncbi:MAG TPA: YihY/virulence factor BrkB family protein [Kofleriaceae bacterium]|nr:YihY/virulence factor BrkB family protein [Kofleriaceae bacterium]
MLGRWWRFFKEVGSQISHDQVTRLAAALAFYAILSLAPLMVVVLAVVGAMWGAAAAQGELLARVQDLVGQQGAEVFRTVIASAGGGRQQGVMAIVGVGAMLLAATAVFAQLQDSLNIVWSVRPKPGRGWWIYLRRRLLSLAVILLLGALLLCSLLATAAVSVVSATVAREVPGGYLLWRLINIALTLAVFSTLFAVLFKVLPDAAIAWRDAWLGGALTAALFTIGKELLAMYLSRAAVGSAYGAAGSLVILLVWIYYSAIMLFVGAEVTEVAARRFGRGVWPKANAVITREA